MGTAVAPLTPLTLYAGFRSLIPILSVVLRVTGDVKFNLMVGTVTLVAMPIVFYIDSAWGPLGIAYGGVIGSPFLVVPLFSRVFRRLSMRTITYLEWLRPAFTCTLLMAAAVLTIKSLLPSALPVWLRLLLCVISGGATYGGTLFLFFRRTLRQMLQSIRRNVTPVSTPA